MRNWIMVTGAALLLAACGGAETPMADATALQAPALSPIPAGGSPAVSYPGKRSDHTVGVGADGDVTVRSGATAPTSVYSGLARIHFADTSLAFDLQSVAGQAYRLYKAAFDRQPDAAGLGYQIT